MREVVHVEHSVHGTALALQVFGLLYRRVFRYRQHPLHLAEALLRVDEVADRDERRLLGVADGVFLDPVHTRETGVEHAERLLLAEAGAGAGLLAREVPPEENLLLRDLSPRHAEAVLRLLQPRRLAAGEWLFREGDPADAVYLLTNGSITVAARGGTRYASFSPGTMLGELAVLDGGDRSADAVADATAEVQVLPCGALAQLTQEDPALAALLYRQIAGHLANRLRQASAAWRDAAG